MWGSGGRAAHWGHIARQVFGRINCTPDSPPASQPARGGGKRKREKDGTSKTPAYLHDGCNSQVAVWMCTLDLSQICPLPRQHSIDILGVGIYYQSLPCIFFLDKKKREKPRITKTKTKTITITKTNLILRFDPNQREKRTLEVEPIFF